MRTEPTRTAAELPPPTTPERRLLANERFVTLLTATGSGFATAGGIRLTGWRGDRLQDDDGSFIYLQDRARNIAWSAAPRPLRRTNATDRIESTAGSMTFSARVEGVATRLHVAVHADLPAEIRILELQNLEAERRTLEVTSWATIVLADPDAFDAHPVFSKLFVQTEFVPAHGALLARRRPRSTGEEFPWMVHRLVGAPLVGWETDRSRFLGRGRDVTDPAALQSDLSGTTGNVLDPIFSLRAAVSLDASGSAALAWLLGSAPDRDSALELAATFDRLSAYEAVLQGADAAAAARCVRLDLDPDRAAVFEALAAAMLCGDPRLRAAATSPPRDLDAARTRPAFSGRPFAVLHAETPTGMALLPEALSMHACWRKLDLPVELVVVAVPGTDEFPASTPGGAPRLVHADARDEVRGLDASARLVLRTAFPSTAAIRSAAKAPVQAMRQNADASRPVRSPPRAEAATVGFDSPANTLVGWNGFGGFAPEGHEYVMHLEPDASGRLQLPPQPWINVLANPEFGCLVSERGAGCAWGANSREHRITPWANDPVVDPHSEAFYWRDEATGEHGSAFAGPTPGPGRYVVRHGFGYTRCEHESAGLRLDSRIFVPPDDPLRIVQVRLENRSRQSRRLAVFAYAQLVLGTRPAEAAAHVVTHVHDDGNTILARSLDAGDFAGRVAFSRAVVLARDARISVTSDRLAFLGEDGNVARPGAVTHGTTLDGRDGAGFEPCMAHRVEFELEPGASTTVAFLLGESRSAVEARDLAARYATPGAIDRAWERMQAYWTDVTGRIQIATPSPAIDRMVNGWATYQTLACRLLARTALQQSGGAFGFRDQLQDAAALVYAAPELTRDQILLHAAHQFLEGDVLHWWHPPHSRGIRTRFADDRLWLPFVTSSYVSTTGDWGILDERRRYLQAPALEPDEDEVFLLPEVADRDGDVYEHCCRAIDCSLEVGAHGLPLFGTGDWNDGMNRVGREGRGESIWMGFFLIRILDDFRPLAERRGDAERLRRYAAHREALRSALERDGWDGDWYRRGYYDDGTPLGSHLDSECRIDALVQAWSVLSRAAPPERASRALDAVEEQLISEADGIVRLLWPPFDRTPHDPGYIKGYVPGVRENGGQYTHAALWVVAALAAAGRNDRAARILEMLSPVTHTATPERVAIYQAEPYVIAADVYGTPPHVGRGGWTWYTGSSGWMLRVALESILGMTVLGGKSLRIAPCVPDDWPGFTLDYRLPGSSTQYAIRATNPHRAGRGVRSARVDGVAIAITDGAAIVPIHDDGECHRIELELGSETTV